MEYFITIQDKQTRYLKDGEGDVLLLLHPTPRTADIFMPFIEILKANFTVIALDTWGYGKSDGLQNEPKDIYDYIPLLNEFIQNIKSNEQKLFIYGSATGAQLAIAYGLTHKVDGLFIDNAAYFTDEERNEILEKYFIDINPKTNSNFEIDLDNHIKKSCLFFPWYSLNEDDRIAIELPPQQILEQIKNDYLNAGPNYWWAYKTAFMHEKVEYVNNLSIPTVLFYWHHSPIKKYIQKLIAAMNNQNVQIVDIYSTTLQRFYDMKDVILSKAKNKNTIFE